MRDFRPIRDTQTQSYNKIQALRMELKNIDQDTPEAMKRFCDIKFEMMNEWKKTAKPDDILPSNFFD